MKKIITGIIVYFVVSFSGQVFADDWQLTPGQTMVNDAFLASCGKVLPVWKTIPASELRLESGSMKLPATQRADLPDNCAETVSHAIDERWSGCLFVNVGRGGSVTCY